MAILSDDLDGIFDAKGVLAAHLPGFRTRASQTEYAKIVQKTIAQSSTAVLEAGTGTGKSFAYLVPVLLSGRQVIISTAGKTLQDQLFNKDVSLLKKALSRPIEACVIKGRSNYICLQRLEAALRMDSLPEVDSGTKLQKLLRFSKTSQTGDISEVEGLSEKDPIIPLVTSTVENCAGRKCKFYDECFVNRARARAAEADVVVTNHHLFLSDLALKKNSPSAGLLPNADVIVFDEAHKLSEIAADYFSETLSLRMISEALDEARRLARLITKTDWDKAAKPVRDAILGLHDFLGLEAGLEDGKSYELEEIRDIKTTGASRISEIEKTLGEFLQSYTKLQSSGDEESILGASQNLLSDIRSSVLLWAQRFREGAKSATIEGAPGILWADYTQRNVVFNLTPLSVAQHFKKARSGSSAAWIFTSATLSVKKKNGEADFSYFFHEMGLPPETEAKSWESPFDFARQAFLYVPDNMPVPKDPDFAAALVDRTWPIIEKIGGRTFFLCTSYDKMNQIADLLRLRMKDPDGLCLQGEAGKNELLAKFKERPDAILVGSMSFWEGVDMKGDALRLVVIDKLPFRPFDNPVQRAREEYMKSRGQRPFVDYQLPLMITQLRQGIGRLIRSEDDWGVVILGDPRFLSASYREKVLFSIPPMTRTRKLQRVLDFLDDPDGAL